MPGLRPLSAALLVWVLLPFGLLSQETEAPESDREAALLVVSVGLFDVSRGADTAQFEIQWRSRPGWVGLRVHAGAMATSKEDSYLYLGLRRDVELGGDWGLSFGAAAGAWSQGESIDLGGSLEFRTAAEIFLATSPRSRLGLEISHISNASLNDRNPGANSLMILYARKL